MILKKKFSRLSEIRTRIVGLHDLPFDHQSHGRIITVYLCTVRQFLLQMESSVTRFGEILSLCWSFKSLWLFLEGLFSIWPNIELTLAIFDAIGQISLL